MFQVLVIPYQIDTDEQPRYLLFKRSDLNVWQWIAGGGEDDEEPEQAARRESFEEAGIPENAFLIRLDSTSSISTINFADRHHWGTDVYGIPEYCFGIRVGDETVRLSGEHKEYVWLDYETAHARLEWDSNRTALRELHDRLLSKRFSWIFGHLLLSCNMIGLNRKSIVLVPHRVEWKSLFESEAKLLCEAVGKFTVAVEHIGSTSIVGLEAKPIIDILVGVQKSADAEKCIVPLSEIGYEYRGESDIAGRFYFRKGEGDISTHHLNIAETTSDFWRKHLLFRDYLRQHAEEAQSYGKLKRKLALKHKGNRPAYTEAKADFIERVLEKADAR